MKLITKYQRIALRQLLDYMISTWEENEIEDYLPNSYQCLGVGNNAIVIGAKRVPFVIKVGKDKAYQRFVRWCWKNPCPQVPKIHYMFSKGEFFVAVLEKLTPYTGDEFDIVDRDDINKMKLSRSMKRILHRMFNMWGNDRSIEMDLQSFNFLRRGKTLVIVDPLYPNNFN